MTTANSRTISAGWEVRRVSPREVDEIRGRLANNTHEEVLNYLSMLSKIDNSVETVVAWAAYFQGQIIGLAMVVWLTPFRTKCGVGFLPTRQIPKFLWVRVVRAMARGITLLERAGFKRIEANVVNTFEPGRRLLKILGFTCETPNGLRNYGSRCETHEIWARCNGG